MSLQIFDMPEETSELRAWLEQQLAGLQLTQLVDELAVVHGEPTSEMTLDQACSGVLDDILQRGMQNVPSIVVQNLLTQPQLLIELQEQICFDGGDYWLSVPVSEEHQAAVDRGWERLEASLTAATISTGSSDTDGPSDIKSEVKQAFASGQSRRSSFRTILLACGLLIAVGVGFLLRPSPHGWNSPARLTAERNPSQIFTALADASNSYIDAPRETSQQLQDEIQRFITDCQQVQRLSLPELAAIDHPDRDLPDSKIATYADWLQVKCKAWEDKAVVVLESLRDGSIDQATAEQQYAEIVTKLKSALEKQAAALA